jgi:hypothetical protein
MKSLLCQVTTGKTKRVAVSGSEQSFWSVPNSQQQQLQQRIFLFSECSGVFQKFTGQFQSYGVPRAAAGVCVHVCVCVCVFVCVCM